MLPSLADLANLDPRYLAHNFQPWAQGISAPELKAAFGTLSTAERQQLEAKLGEECRRFLADADSSRVDPGIAALKVLAIYFWEIVYHRYPDDYEALSACQTFPFDDLFPIASIGGKRALDVAAGAGKLALHVVKYAGDVVAVDPSAPLLRSLARRASGINLRCEMGAFAALPLPDRSADVVISNLGFQVSEERGGECGLAEMVRVLRPGGEIRLVVGSARTEAWLRRRGFREVATHRPIRWSLPQHGTWSPVLRVLLRSIGVPEVPGACLIDRWLFVRRRPSPARIAASLMGLADGVRTTEVFDRGVPWRPLGCSVMVWRP